MLPVFELVQKDKMPSGRKPRPRKDPIYLDNGTVEMFLSNGRKTIIDNEDFQVIKELPWSMNRSGYAYHKKDTITFLHRFIMKPPNNMVIDHINGNSLDNRRCNLRIVTTCVNIHNRTVINSNNTSGIRGVVWDKNRNKWQARIKINYKLKLIGRFDNKEDAKLAIDYFKKSSSYKEYYLPTTPT